MHNERNRTNKNQEQGDSDTSQRDRTAAYCREFAEALRRTTRGSEEYGGLREGLRRIQGDFQSRFWDDGWNE